MPGCLAAHDHEEGAAPTVRRTLTGAGLPGLSANPVAVEDWWGDRSRRLWAARRM